MVFLITESQSVFLTSLQLYNRTTVMIITPINSIEVPDVVWEDLYGRMMPEDSKDGSS